MRQPVLIFEFLLFVLFLLLGSYQPALAIPAFARKYKTSCMTCHAVFPKLNAFGQVFRRLGYRFPEGQDAQLIKEEPVKMGAKAYKRLWPKAVWPSDIPGTAPVAFILESEISVDTESDNSRVDFSNMMGEAEILTGGTIGDDINFLTSFELSQDGIDIEMGYVGIYNILKREKLNLKIGQFPPEVLFVSNHRRFGPTYWITTRTVANNEWSLENSQKGFEANGILLNGRSFYDLGLVEGRGNILNPYKDSYAHLAYKIGGLAYDGSGEVQRNQFWGDNSIQLGAFTYLGKAELEIDHEDSFIMGGGDVEINYHRVRFNGGLVFRNDDRPFTDSLQANISTNSRVYFLEADYMVYPWLIPTFRYEGWMVDRDDGNSIESQQRFIPTLQALIRANVRSYVSMAIKEKNDSFDLDEIEFGLLLGF